MPFIVTTKSRYGGANDLGYLATASRRAVATLEDARAEAHRAIMDMPDAALNIAEARAVREAGMPVASAVKFARLHHEIEAWADAGGTIALPDGTVIEVEATA